MKSITSDCPNYTDRFWFFGKKIWVTKNINGFQFIKFDAFMKQYYNVQNNLIAKLLYFLANWWLTLIQYTYAQVTVTFRGRSSCLFIYFFCNETYIFVLHIVWIHMKSPPCKIDRVAVSPQGSPNLPVRFYIERNLFDFCALIISKLCFAKILLLLAWTAIIKSICTVPQRKNLDPT